MRKLGIVLVALMLLVGCSQADKAQVNSVGCSKDTDCKGERICENGLCVNPVVAAVTNNELVLTPVEIVPTENLPENSEFSVGEKVSYLKMGKLEIVNSNEEGYGRITLKFNGKTIRDEGDYNLSQQSGFNIGDHQMVLFEASSGGRACNQLYFIVDVDAAGNVTTTKDFGTCSEEEPLFQLNGNEIVFMFSGYQGPFEPVEEQIAAGNETIFFIYRDGEVIGPYERER